MSALFDFPSLIIVILLFICSTSFLRALYPSIFTTKSAEDNATSTSTATQHRGLYGICWKASRIGERLSPAIAVTCIIMAFHVLFIKA